MKTFQELFDQDISKFVEVKEQDDGQGKKKEFKYLSWAYAWAQTKILDPKANYVIHETAEGNPFFVSPFGIDVKVSVTFQEVTHTMRLPVLNHSNKPMKADSYKYSTKNNGERTVEAANMFDINKTIMRCLVKAIALHGIGLSLYAGEDLPTEQKVSKSIYVEDGRYWIIVKGYDKTKPEQKAAIKELGFIWDSNEFRWAIETNTEISKIPAIAGITYELINDLGTHDEEFFKQIP